MLWATPLHWVLHEPAVGIAPGHYFLCLCFHRPFMAALCSLVKGDLEKLGGFLASCLEVGGGGPCGTISCSRKDYKSEISGSRANRETESTQQAQRSLQLVRCI